jgi:polysaccharide export outer membrane protein
VLAQRGDSAATGLAAGGDVVRSSDRLWLSIVLIVTMAATLPVGAQDPVRAEDLVRAQGLVRAEDDEGEWSHWTSGRYRITPGDVLEVTFPFVPELNQTVTVQPDGYITLKEIRDIRVQGRTVAQVTEDVLAAYTAFVREPAATVVLKEFQRPYFVASGEVEQPGRYELRGATTLTQALALAGGPRRGANVSQVVLYRRLPDSSLEVKEVNVSRMYAKRDLSEDPLLRPGDTIVVPKGVFGKLMPMLEFLRLR